jgi:hypothetical protein
MASQVLADYGQKNCLFTWFTEVYGFVQSKVTPALTISGKGEEWINLVSYIDDCAVKYSSDDVHMLFESALSKRFDCKLMGKLQWFLQACITQHANFDIMLDQLRYAASISSCLIPSCEVEKPTEADKQCYSAPLPRDFVFTTEDCSKDLKELQSLSAEFHFKYPVAVGCLLWLLNTYPRLQFAVRKLAKFMQLPGCKHFQAISHTLHHVHCHHQMGVTFYSDLSNAPLSNILSEVGIDPNTELVAATDSSWQDCPDTG